MVWPTLGSRTAKEQKEQIIEPSLCPAQTIKTVYHLWHTPVGSLPLCWELYTQSL